MKRVLIFMMLAVTVLIAASNVVPERIAPDPDVGYVVDINNDINAETILSENTIFTIERTGDRQEVVADATIRSGPITSETVFVYNYNYRINNDQATVFRLCSDSKPFRYTSSQRSTKEKPAVVFRV